MKTMIVLADDLSGAAEIAGVGVERGLASVVARGPSVGNADLIVFDTDSRSLAAAAAASRVTTILQQWLPQDAEVIFKKTDSVLRGPIAAELEAILPILGKSRALLIAQNPSKGRVISSDGSYLINSVPLDQTMFRGDPEYPRLTALAVDLVKSSARGPVGHADGGQNTLPDGVIIGTGETVFDVQQWARRATADSQMLMAGGADAFRALLESRGLHGAPKMDIQIDADQTLVVCGSTASYSRETVTGWLRDGMPVCDINDALFVSPATAELAVSWALEAMEMMQEHRMLVLAIRRDVVAKNAADLRQRMSEVVREIIEATPRLDRSDGRYSLSVLIEGGATAAAISDAMRWTDFAVLGNVGAGVVAMRPLLAAGVLMVIKPGSYPWGSDVLRYLQKN